eukprot:TRINITY_DN102718_c0_g1_i1.p1 TRINITY_DN102718_c0_g1~~TRINITY_DN102718_c0_g1_i1.p1  ORF type:complete len:336 (-),score=83.95 TRINITY_DN102718_c0_g1_i1:80-1087(-)
MGSYCSYDKPKEMPNQWFDKFYEELPSMEGKTVVVTGCTTGTGYHCAVSLAKKGASVAMLNRKSERADKAFADVKAAATKGKVVNIACDMQSFASVKEAVGQLKSEFADGIDVLCNNAGIMATKDEATEDGYDTQMQTNHLSHFLLTQQAWPLLLTAASKRGEARVVNHSSGAARMCKTLEAKYLGKNGGNLGGDACYMPFSGPRWDRYAQTKFANIVFTYALRDRADAAGIKVKSLVAHPGVAATNLQVTTTQDGGMSGGLSNACVSQSAQDGAMGILRCCCDPAVKSGDYYGPTGMGMAGPADLMPVDERAEESVRTMLWAESEKATGVQFQM